MRILLAAFFILNLTGCSNQSAYQAELKREMAKSEKLEKMANTPGLLEGDGCQINLVGTNPKNSNGLLIPQLKADAENATIKFQDGSLNVILNQVHATLNSMGKPAYSLVADQVTANQKNEIAKAKGHVHLYSLRGKTLNITANEIDWNRHLNQILALGDVYIVYVDSNGTLHTQHGPRVTYKTVTGEVSY